MSVLLVLAMIPACSVLRQLKLLQIVKNTLKNTKKENHEPCIFLLWNRGLPKKLFLILVSLVFQSCCPEAGQVDPVIEADWEFI